MELTPDLITVFLAVLFGVGGSEGVKYSVRKLKKHNNSSQDQDYVEHTNPGFNDNVPRSECHLKHLNITDQLKATNEHIIEIQKDIKILLSMQTSLVSLEGKINTQISDLKGAMPIVVEKALEKHEKRFHKVA